MKKYIIAIGIMISLIVGAFFVRQWHMETQEKEIIKAEKKKAETLFSSSEIAIKNDKNNSTIFMVPLTDSKDIETELERWHKEAEKISPHKKNQLIFLNAKMEESPLEGIKKLTIYRTVYQSKWLNIEKVTEKALRDFYIHDNGQLFYLKELVKGDENQLVSTISNYLKEHQIDNQEKILGKIKQLDLVSEFKKKGEASNYFSFKKGYLKLGNDAEIPLSVFYDNIDVTYLSGEELTNYQNYQIKKKEEEEAKIAAEKAKQAEENRKKIANQGRKVVALTFDDGPSAKTTPQVLDILAKYNIRATFYVLGSHVAGNEGILQRMVASGHELGNHSWDHPALTGLTSEQVKWQIQSTNDAIMKATGVSPKTVRPPYGDSNPKVAQDVGLPLVFWTVDTRDWAERNTPSILTNLKATLGSGGVILMHDIHQTSVDALPTVIDYLISQGYEFVTVSELYGY
ncbi:polysaccharide deacetylase family protein [Streptococcus sp. CSL10205-OR2]|uniref:polysaccharide deacetylase family protein n=1 Tax=Streptococcus sp. CSL10205-OR2 TaxID=2980558 RepID=UPI0021DB75A2|nr:polysaccharide deacetylase family protein [Streptococcus sp. CSL10205-OR2]MCU9533932.1 polysaccharide deacetylase family protein [Streptococcus sp. CSL10205-OR2]